MSRQVQDFSTFQLHDSLVNQAWGAGKSLVRGRISQTLLKALSSAINSDKDYFCVLDLSELRTRHPVLSTSNFHCQMMDQLFKSITPGKLHRCSYSDPLVKSLHDELRKMFGAYIGSPFVFVNTRIWRTEPGSPEFGPNDFHTDGFEPGHMKIMVYVTPLSRESGYFEVKDTDGVIYELIDEPSGVAICFSNSDVEHRGVPGVVSERISIEVTLMRTLVDGEQRWPGHFLGRHLKYPKLLNSTQLNTNETDGFKFDPPHFQCADFSSASKVNIGSGNRNWDGWICLDQLDADGVTNITFDEIVEFPIDAASVSLFYSSHFFEHASDEVIHRILSEMKKTALPNCVFVLKIPDFSWFLDQYKFGVADSMVGKGIESVLWSWESKGVEDSFENRLAMMFCGYWTSQYGDHFSGAITRQAGAYHGPPIFLKEELGRLFMNGTPHEVARTLVERALSDPHLKAFNHQNAWSSDEVAKLMSEFGARILHNDREIICNQFAGVIPDIESMKDWSAYYLCKF